MLKFENMSDPHMLQIRKKLRQGQSTKYIYKVTAAPRNNKCTRNLLRRKHWFSCRGKVLRGKLFTGREMRDQGEANGEENRNTTASP